MPKGIGYAASSHATPSLKKKKKKKSSEFIKF